MADYYLNMTTWSLETNDEKVAEVNNLDSPDGIAEMKQRIGIAIKTHLGEKLLDTSLGLPYKERILVKNPDLEQIASDTRAYLTTRVEGVTSVISLKIEFDRATRIMEWSLNVETDSGVTGPFNLTI